MSMDEFAFSLRMRDTIKKMVNTVLDDERPKYRYGTVMEIDRPLRKCSVTLNGDTAPILVSMGALQPKEVGQVVRVEGLRGDRFIADVLGQPFMYDDNPPPPPPAIPHSTVVQTDGNGAGTSSTGYVNLPVRTRITNFVKHFSDTKLVVRVSGQANQSGGLNVTYLAVDIGGTDYPLASALGALHVLGGEREITGIGAGTISNIELQWRVNAGTATMIAHYSLSVTETY